MGVLSLSRGITQTTSDEHKLAADWNGDGLINIDDVMGVLSRSRGMVRDDEWRFYDKAVIQACGITLLKLIRWILY